VKVASGNAFEINEAAHEKRNKDTTTFFVTVGRWLNTQNN
jgi:hypothetical protein